MTDLPVLVSNRSVARPQPQALEPMQLDMKMAAELAKSEIVPRAYRGKPSNVLVAIGLGRSLGLEPAPSLYGMHVIDGTPSPSAKLQAALVRRAGHKLRVLDSTNEQATVQIVRHDDPEFPFTVTFTADDAAAAGLLDVTVERWNDRQKQSFNLGPSFPYPCTEHQLQAAGAPSWAKPFHLKRRENWFSNRSEMLHHRAVTRCVGRACPEVVSGLDFDSQVYSDDAPSADVVDTITAAPVDHPDGPGLIDGGNAVETVGGSTPPAATEIVDAEIVPEVVEPDPLTDPLTVPELRDLIKLAGKTQRETIEHAQEIATGDKPGSLQAILESADAPAVLAWLSAAATDRTAADPFGAES